MRCGLESEQQRTLTTMVVYDWFEAATHQSYTTKKNLKKNTIFEGGDFFMWFCVVLVLCHFLIVFGVMGFRGKYIFGRLWCHYTTLRCLDVKLSLCGCVVMCLCRYVVVLICGCVEVYCVE